MYLTILQKLLSSSLSAMMSGHEIEEIAIQLEDDIQAEVDTQIEQAKDEYEQICSDNCSLKKTIRQYEIRNSKLPLNSVQDDMVLDWIKENWEDIIEIWKLNVSAKELITHFESKSFDKVKIEDHKRIALVGRAASGKDHARKLFMDRHFKHAISYTTRPERKDEANGIDYHFLSEEEFKKKIDNDEFYEHVSFNGWHYGTSKRQFYSDDIFIMTPSGISKLKPEDRKNTFIIYFDVPYEIRKERLSKRSDADTVERRLEADDQDFKDFIDFDLRITTPEFDLNGFLKQKNNNNINE